MTLHHRIAFILCLALAAAVPVQAQEATAVADSDAIALASTVLDRMEAGDFQGVSADFNAQMQAGLRPDGLADVQRQIEATGPVVERGEPRVLRHDGYTVIVFRIQREQAAIDATIAIDGEGKVGGLHFVPANGASQ